MDKASWRAEILQRRASRSESERTQIAEAIAAHVLALPEVVKATTVSCYLSSPSEPGTAPLIAGLRALGIRILLPRGKTDPDWFDDAEPETLLGASAIAEADFLIIPGLAVDHRGLRLGRGGGYFDRVLAISKRPSCVLLFSNEVVPELPSEPHDQLVHMVATELGVARLTLT